MDKLKECARAFDRLTNIEYRIVVGRKGVTRNINLKFRLTEFHHLLGLHKLKDNMINKEGRTKVFEKILQGKITYAKLQQSSYFSDIENRVEPFVKLERLLDKNDIIFKYNNKVNLFSKIQADFLLCSKYIDNDIYIFISKHGNEDDYFCRSFFPKENIDFRKGQAKYTLLYKEKINVLTNEIEVQYDRLNRQNLKLNEKYNNKEEMFSQNDLAYEFEVEETINFDI